MGDMSSPNPKIRRRKGSIWSLESHIVGGTRNKLFYPAVCSLRKLSNKTIEAHTKRGVKTEEDRRSPSIQDIRAIFDSSSGAGPRVVLQVVQRNC